MKITICGSIACVDEMIAAKTLLESRGHEVDMPPLQIPDGSGSFMTVQEYHTRRHAAADSGDLKDVEWIWEQKNHAIKDHFRKIEWSDAILVLNYPKRGINGYIGGNTLIEMGIALHLGKRIFLMFPVPAAGTISYREEVLGMLPTILDGDLLKIEE